MVKENFNLLFYFIDGGYADLASQKLYPHKSDFNFNPQLVDKDLEIMVPEPQDDGIQFFRMMAAIELLPDEIEIAGSDIAQILDACGHFLPREHSEAGLLGLLLEGD